MASPRFTRSLVSTIHAVSLCRRLGLLSCSSTWPHELADRLVARPLMVTMLLSTVPPVECKCAAAAAGPSLRLAQSDRFVRVLFGPLVEQPRTRYGATASARTERDEAPGPRRCARPRHSPGRSGAHRPHGMWRARGLLSPRRLWAYTLYLRRDRDSACPRENRDAASMPPLSLSTLFRI